MRQQNETPIRAATHQWSDSQPIASGDHLGRISANNSIVVDGVVVALLSAVEESRNVGDCVCQEVASAEDENARAEQFTYISAIHKVRDLPFVAQQSPAITLC